MKYSRIALGIIALVLIVLAVFAYQYYANQSAQTNTSNTNNTNKPITLVTNFEECVAEGNPVQESYPRRCTARDGATFTEDIGNELEKADLIRVTNPRPNQTIASPLKVTGEARGTWYFEATFPLKLLNETGSVIATGYAQAQGEWMTENFVPFEGTLTFTAPTSGKGTLVLEKDNPSGLPEHADELRMPVKFNSELMSINVFLLPPDAAGPPNFDCSTVVASERKIPKTSAVARAAIVEGAIVARNIIEAIKTEEGFEKKPIYKFFKPTQYSYIIPAGGKWAIACTNTFVFKGYWAWVFKGLVELGYLLSIMPALKALKIWLAGLKIFIKNDRLG